MADSYNKKEREKKKRKKKQDKAEMKKQRKLEGGIKPPEFVYQDIDGNISETPPDPTEKKVEIKLEDIEIGVPKKIDDGTSKYAKEGMVKFFNTEKGYGFINEKISGDSYFVHVDNLTGTVKERDLVSFDVGSGPKGPIALNVKLIPKK